MRKASFLKLMLVFTLLLGIASLFDMESIGAKTARTAIIEDITGTVYVKKAGGTKSYRAYTNMALNYGDHITTEDHSSVVLTVVDRDDEITIGPNTELFISELKEDQKGNKKSKFKAWAGSIWAKASTLFSSEDEFEIATPTAIMGVRGTNFFVGIDPHTGDTRLFVSAGIVQAIKGGAAKRDASHDGQDESQEGAAFYPSMEAYLYSDIGEDGLPPLGSFVDILDLMDSVDESLIEAIIRNKQQIEKENEEFILSLMSGKTAFLPNYSYSDDELDRIGSNLDKLIDSIIGHAVNRGVISEEDVEELFRSTGAALPDIDYTNPPSLDLSEEEKAQQERTRRLQEERDQERQRKQEELLKRQKEQQELQERLIEQRARQEADNQAAMEERKRQAEERYKQKLLEEQRRAFDESKTQREQEREQQEQRRQDRMAPPSEQEPSQSGPTSGGGGSGGGSTPPALDVTALYELLEQVAHIESTFYTSESFSHFEEMRQYAHSMTEDAKTQQDINEAWEALNNAEGGLVKRHIVSVPQRIVQRYQLGVVQEGDIILPEKVGALMSDRETVYFDVEWTESDMPFDFFEGDHYYTSGIIREYDADLIEYVAEVMLEVYIGDLIEFNGKVSLPNGEVAPDGDLEIILSLLHGSDYEDTTVVIPAGQNAIEFSQVLAACTGSCPAVDHLRYKIPSEGHADVDYVMKGHLAPDGSTSYTKQPLSFANTLLDLQNINLEIIKGQVISGEIRFDLPVPEDVYIDIRAEFIDFWDEPFSKQIVIPADEDMGQYSIRVVPNNNYEVKASIGIDYLYEESLPSHTVNISSNDLNDINFPSTQQIDNLSIQVEGTEIKLQWDDPEIGGDGLEPTFLVNGYAANYDWTTDSSIRINEYYNHYEEVFEQIKPYSSYLIQVVLQDDLETIIKHSIAIVMTEEEEVDIEDLQFLLYLSYAIPSYVYTSESFSDLHYQIIEAHNMLGDEFKTQADVDLAYINLTLALENLEQKNGQQWINDIMDMAYHHSDENRPILIKKDAAELELPTTATAIMFNGDRQVVSVEWDDLSLGDIDTGEPGMHDITGYVAYTHEAFNVKLKVAETSEISGKIQLPDGIVAPAGGLHFVITAENDEDMPEYRDKYVTEITMAGGENTADYTIVVANIDNEDVPYVISYELLTPNVENIVNKGFYHSDETVPFRSEADQVVCKCLNDLTGIDMEVLTGTTISGKIILSEPAPVSGQFYSVTAAVYNDYDHDFTYTFEIAGLETTTDYSVVVPTGYSYDLIYGTYIPDETSYYYYDDGISINHGASSNKTRINTNDGNAENIDLKFLAPFVDFAAFELNDAIYLTWSLPDIADEDDNITIYLHGYGSEYIVEDVNGTSYVINKQYDEKLGWDIDDLKPETAYVVNLNYRSANYDYEVTHQSRRVVKTLGGERIDELNIVNVTPNSISVEWGDVPEVGYYKACLLGPETFCVVVGQDMNEHTFTDLLVDQFYGIRIEAWGLEGLLAGATVVEKTQD